MNDFTGKYKIHHWITKSVALTLSVLSTVTTIHAETYDCMIEPYQIINISSPVEGLIEEIKVDTGDVVSEGDVLVALESSVEKAVVETARARAASQGELKAKETQYSFRKRQANRLKELFAKQAVSSHEKDEADTNVTLAKLELKQSQETIELAILDLKRAEAELNQRTVESPVNGVVMDRQMSPGEFVREDPILRLAQLDPLRIETILPASRFGSVKMGGVDRSDS